MFMEEENLKQMDKTCPKKICIQCKEVLEEPGMFSCAQGHLFCEDCYFEIPMNRTSDPVCPVCGSNLIMRSVPKKPPGCYASVSGVPIYNKNVHSSGEPVDYYSTEPSTSFQSNISKKSIYCPNGNCKKLIGITNLVSHYTFEHSEIPKRNVMFDEPATMEVSLNLTDYDTSCCIGLFILADDDDLPNGILEPAIAFPVFAAKFHNGLVVLWVCGNSDQSHRCLLQLTDERRSSVHSYYGLVNSLRGGVGADADNDPVPVYRRANCLLMQIASVNRLTNYGNSSVKIKLIVTE